MFYFSFVICFFGLGLDVICLVCLVIIWVFCLLDVWIDWCFCFYWLNSWLFGFVYLCSLFVFALSRFVYYLLICFVCLFFSWLFIGCSFAVLLFVWLTFVGWVDWVFGLVVGLLFLFCVWLGCLFDCRVGMVYECVGLIVVYSFAIMIAWFWIYWFCGLWVCFVILGCIRRGFGRFAVLILSWFEFWFFCCLCVLMYFGLIVCGCLISVLGFGGFGVVRVYYVCAVSGYFVGFGWVWYVLMFWRYFDCCVFYFVICGIWFWGVLLILLDFWVSGGFACLI